MKKIYLGLMAASAVLVACDPIVDGKDWSGETMSESVLSDGIVLKQYDLTAEGEYVESADGNFIEFATNPGKVVDIYYLNADGAEMSLSRGKASGMFELSPSRGSDPVQTVYFRTYEFDGSSVTASKQVTVKVATELAKEMAIICSNAGTKTWMWDLSRPQVWGNFGYTPGTGEDFANSGSGIWWGVATPEELTGQLQHSDTGVATGEESSDATMIFTETGIVKCFDANGNEIRKGSFSIVDYSDENKHVVNDQPWSVGTLHTTPGAILFPFKINGGGTTPTDFDIIRLTADQLVLTYADAGTSSWAEATFWYFTSSSDGEGVVAGYDKTGENWGWDVNAPGGEVWGNMGYTGSTGVDWTTTTDGKWWGVKSEDDFMGQMNHSAAGKATGEESFDAYMTFTPDGQSTVYTADGTALRSGSWSIDYSTASSWKIGNFNLTNGAILWPYEINSGGNIPTTFDLVHLSKEQMVLVYPDGGDFGALGNWGEASFWRFMKK